ncbi:hypothetical protein CYLTODRAFT_361167 [Cylindrobasidium torrendii FP15055 ss-10]|uniref:DUF4218 domain-containing protein n=1 Tax=Cylindrobasidium torrendii FP15055 ss-10 TaxID=1314674 RepID=A0A0D7AWL0_9AGAR|nr:hypothetical protein CYLTODRAFT_361167 [Cylindrobasidium torrendii FP15055 ss-10]
MEASRLDLQNAILPMNVDRPPYNWGTPTRGKLSAEQWDLVCLVFLPITAIRLWGYPYRDARFRAILHNMIDLVKAMLMVVNRTSSQGHADSYRQHLDRHLQTITKLFPHYYLKPIHHIASHFPDFLGFLGPSHGFQIPAFERINYMLQSTNKNRKHGAFIHQDKSYHLRYAQEKWRLP